jgi:hypothetical protein
LFPIPNTFLILSQANILKKERIDGEALLTLTREEITKMGLCMGPAKKLESTIGWLRTLHVPKKSSPR